MNFLRFVLHFNSFPCENMEQMDKVGQQKQTKI